MNQFNLLDWILIIVLFAGALFGYQRGFIHQVLHFLGFIIAYMVAFQFYDEAAQVLSLWIPFPAKSDQTYFSFVTEILQLERMFYSAIAFGLLFILSKFGLNLLAHMLNLVASLPGLNLFNRLGGAFIGFASTFLIMVIVLNILFVMPSENLQVHVRESVVAKALVEKTPYLSEHLHKLWKKSDESEEEPTI